MWDIRIKEPKDDLYYILVDIFENSPRYYIFISKEIMNECKKNYNPLQNRTEGIYVKTAEDYEKRWEILPK